MGAFSGSSVQGTVKQNAAGPGLFLSLSTACPWHVHCASSLPGRRADSPVDVCTVLITQQGKQPLTADR